MLDGDNPKNLRHIMQLRDLAQEAKKPIVIWVGAGASKWCGYPLWIELAERFHSTFLKRESKYDKQLGRKYLSDQEFPALFDYCKGLNSRAYYSVLAESLNPRTPTPLYNRFLDSLRGIKHLYILTTNVDETLEKHLAEAATIQLTDIERLADLLQRHSPFICKLHGTSSAIRSAVFTATEYSVLCGNYQFIWTLQNIFATSAVVFLGYGLRDQYVLESLAAADHNKPIFGAGPHFAVLPREDPKLPESILQITYTETPQKDHRSAIDILDIIRNCQETPRIEASSPPDPQRDVSPTLSSFYISDFVLPGPWQSSQSLTAVHSSGREINVLVGQGFTNNELPSQVSTALHDLAVGLICFDVVYFPLSEFSRVYSFLGDQRFWAMIESGAIEFVHLGRQGAVIYENLSRQDGGDFGMVGRSNPDGSLMSTRDSIRAYVRPAEGKESVLEPLLSKLDDKVRVIPDAALEVIPTMVRGCLLGPRLRAGLGISDAVSPTAIPRWNAFHVLRLAHLITIGTVCQQLGIGAARISFGGECLVGPAFSFAASPGWADQIASYTLSGRFNSVLGAIINNDISTFDTILKFRDTSEAGELRRQMSSELDANASVDFVASVNAGLKRIVSIETMDKARDQLIGLLTAGPSRVPLVRAVWNNYNNADSVLKRWRERSARELRQYCRTYGIRLKDQCPCSSGEKLRDCCAHALDLERLPD